MKTDFCSDGKYKNPIIFADYSDPDVIRVDDTFYMTASSFNYTPGLPILVSKDLVNWELKNYALENIGQERYKIPRHSEGVWAPSIRYHDGMFYIYYGMPDEGYYVVRTKDPLGKWDEPICVLEGKGLIDPCPFWDDDGKAYIIHGYAKSRIGFKSILGIFEMNAEGTKAISEDHFVFDGNDPEHPAVTIEGPKVYKRNGYYYIWAPAGGVKYGYQVVLRSRDIHGPFEIRTVMEQGDSVINGPHQGGLVDTACGDEWFIHFQDRGLYGRICHLQPVFWNGDWPVVGSLKDIIGEAKENCLCGNPVYDHDMPNCGIDSGKSFDEAKDTSCKDHSRNALTSGKPALDWQWMGDHDDSFFEVIKDFDDQQTAAFDQKALKGLRLFCQNPSGDVEPILWRSANVLTKKLSFPVFEETVSIDANRIESGDRAGVCMMGGQYVTAYIEKCGDDYYICTAKSSGDDSNKKEEVISKQSLDDLCRKSGLSIKEVLSDIKFIMTFTYKDRDFDSGELYFRNVDDPMFGENPSLYMGLSISDGDTADLGVKFTPSDHTWVGAKTGIFAISSGTGKQHGYADFKTIVTKEL